MVSMLVLLAGLVGCTTEPPAETKPPEPAKVETPAEPPKPAEPAKPATPDWATATDADKKAWLMAKGEDFYKNGDGGAGIACTTCHGADGKGTPGSFPPLAGSSKEMGDCKNHAGYIVHGLTGEVTVQGQKYNSAMPKQDSLSDETIAAAITYERNSFGNDLGICLPADVAEARKLPAPTVPK